MRMEGPIRERWDTLSKELKVAVEIHRLNEATGVPYFSRIAKNLADEDMSPTTIHNALDNLMDLGTINAEWEKLDSRWVRRFFVAGESREFIGKLAEGLYEE